MVGRDCWICHFHDRLILYKRASEALTPNKFNGMESENQGNSAVFVVGQLTLIIPEIKLIRKLPWPDKMSNAFDPK